ncbi:LacI family DNA-binding transcriptional regulator [Lacticaseibacillus sp. 53-4]|uniref:LacI family DNA-binding transcriptional regulator n=1 Tax=Lacticaseibacillus sp. 53-4 TaxID=2799575 RepID=UPI001941C8A1|nr:LacI family DNA-binding transcriptional regulator [Lacticaseibacillus sp. 53-4]
MVAKLTDVAELAGVSATTVSRVINHKGYLSSNTIEKVNASMRELNYQPNNIARSLQGKSTHLVGLIFPTLDSIFFAELTNLLERELFAHGYKTIICNSQGDPKKERDYLQMLGANQVEGIISSSHNLNHADYARASAPIIGFDRYFAPNIPIVSSDNFSGGQLAARELLKHPIHDLVMLTGNDDPASPTHRRVEGFKDILAHKNIQPRIISLAQSTTPTLKLGAIKALLRQTPPEGIFCSDDMTALMVMNVARGLGISIPGDLYLVGYDGVSFIRDYIPQLTTIQQPLPDLAKLSVSLLERRIKDPSEQLSDHYELPVKVISGESC